MTRRLNGHLGIKSLISLHRTSSSLDRMLVCKRWSRKWALAHAHICPFSSVPWALLINPTLLDNAALFYVGWMYCPIFRAAEISEEQAPGWGSMIDRRSSCSLSCSYSSTETENGIQLGVHGVWGQKIFMMILTQYMPYTLLFPLTCAQSDTGLCFSVQICVIQWRVCWTAKSLYSQWRCLTWERVLMSNRVYCWMLNGTVSVLTSPWKGRAWMQCYH